MSTTTPAPSTSSSRTLIIGLAAGALVFGFCAGLTCGLPVGWFGKGSASAKDGTVLPGSKKSGPIEGTWVRPLENPKLDHWTTIEFKRNGIYVVQPGNITGKYSIENGVVTFDSGIGRGFGEFEGEKLRMENSVYEKK